MAGSGFYEEEEENFGSRKPDRQKFQDLLVQKQNRTRSSDTDAASVISEDPPKLDAFQNVLRDLTF